MATIDVTDVVSVVATLSTVMLFLTGVPIVQKIIRKGSSADASFFPFLSIFCNFSLWVKYGMIKGDGTIILTNSVGCTLSAIYIFIFIICSSLWLKYGMMKGDGTIMLTNSVGCTLSAIYMFLFIIYTLNKTGVYRQTVCGAVLLFTVLFLVQNYTASRQQALLYLGVISATVGVVAYGAPLSALSTVMRTQSTEVMAFPMCLANFIVAVEWFGYGSIKGDRFIQVPNCLGIFLGIIQLSLFVIYPSKASRIQTT